MKFDIAALSHTKETWEYREEPENLRLLGQYLWRILLALALLALLAAIWLGMQELAAVSQAESTTVTTSAPPVPLDPNTLQAQLALYTARQQDYQTISSSPLPQIGDPSSN